MMNIKYLLIFYFRVFDFTEGCDCTAIVTKPLSILTVDFSLN